MLGTVTRVFAFLLVVLGAFLWVGSAITALTGGEKRAGGAVEVGPEGGETIFWGKGRCFTCHSLGDQGSAVRGPNLGVFGEKFPVAVGARAAERAKQRSQETGLSYSITDYLVESLGKPDAYLVEGYKNEMAIVYAPPISLSLTEIKAVISFLQTQGGDLDLEAIENPGPVAKKYYERIAAASAAGGGDPGHGEEVYADNCSGCHLLKGEGGKVGPALDGIAAAGPKLISESILVPAKKIARGYETWVVVEKDGRKTTGLKTRDEAGEVEMTTATGDVRKIAKADIKEMEEDKGKSLMPDDLIEAMTVKDFQDVVAYMMLQKAAPQAANKAQSPRKAQNAQKAK
jgi:putative heme-binding domain-containing protein